MGTQGRGILRTSYIARAALIAAVYVLLVYFFQPISFGPGQIRIAESLAILAFFEAAAVPGLWVGCLLANALGGLGPWDIFGGSTITLLAAWLTNRAGHVVVGMIPPIVLNAFGVSAYLSFIFGIPYWIMVGQVLFGQVIAVGVIGGLLAAVLYRLHETLNLHRRY